MVAGVPFVYEPRAEARKDLVYTLEFGAEVDVGIVSNESVRETQSVVDTNDVLVGSADDLETVLAIVDSVSYMPDLLNEAKSNEDEALLTILEKLDSHPKSLEYSKFSSEYITPQTVVVMEED